MRLSGLSTSYICAGAFTAASFVQDKGQAQKLIDSLEQLLGSYKEITGSDGFTITDIKKFARSCYEDMSTKEGYEKNLKVLRSLEKQVDVLADALELLGFGYGAAAQRSIEFNSAEDRTPFRLDTKLDELGIRLQIFRKSIGLPTNPVSCDKELIDKMVSLLNAPKYRFRR